MILKLNMHYNVFSKEQVSGLVLMKGSYLICLWEYIRQKGLETLNTQLLPQKYLLKYWVCLVVCLLTAVLSPLVPFLPMSKVL